MTLAAILCAVGLLVVLIAAGRVQPFVAFIITAIAAALVLVLAWALGLDGVSRDVALLFAALPTATSAYILARQLGGDAELMAALITGQTLLAMLSLPLWLSLTA